MTNLPPPDLTRFASVFVVKPSSLGDIVHTLPAVHLLKHAHPRLRFRWLCNPEWIPILEGNPDLHEILPFPRRQFRGIGGAAKFFRWTRELNAYPRENPELVIDFQGLLRSALISQARGADTIIGMSDAREGATFLQRHTVTVDPSAHAVDRNLAVVSHLGLKFDKDSLPFPLPSGHPPADPLPPRYLLLHPYSRGHGKSLSRETLQALCNVFAPRPVIIAGRLDRAPPISGSHVVSLINQTDLSQLLWLIRHADACLSVDSGPMHIAAAAGIPTIGVYTWSNPRQVGPYQKTAWVWKAGRIARRHEFTDAEVLTHQNADPDAARLMGEFLLSLT